MSVRKCVFAVGSCGSFGPLPSPLSPSSTLSNPTTAPRSTCPRARRPRCQQSRSSRFLCNTATRAASATSESSSTTPTPLSWPETLHAHSTPTPYQIFHQRRGEPYSKQRFYELVKLYHPDRHNHLSLDATAPPASPTRTSTADLGHATLVERYRLVVAANAILSDPNRRAAYDRYGFGWDDGSGADPSATSGGVDAHGNPLYRYTTRHRWRPAPDGSRKPWWPTDADPMYNATWEDWERWYARTSAAPAGRDRGGSGAWTADFFFSDRGGGGGARRHSHSTVYASNGAFISLVFLLAALGGIGQATRATDFARSRSERSAAVSEETSRVLMRVRDDTRDAGGTEGEGKDGRIRRFLREKESYAEGEFDARALRPGVDEEGLCVSARVEGKGRPRFWEKPPEQR